MTEVRKRTYLSPPDTGPEERRLLLDAFDSNWVAPLGPHVDAFEREFADLVGLPHAVALSSGTAALHLALVILGIGRGDDVAHVDDDVRGYRQRHRLRRRESRVRGRVPRHVERSIPDLLEEHLKRRAGSARQVSAVIAVDLYGQCADYARLTDICSRYGVPLVEDAAEALGATYGSQRAGVFGECAAFSFNGNKIITTGGGGMLVSHRGDIVERARHLADPGKRPRSALSAFPNRVQLPAVQPARRCRSWPVAVAAGQARAATRDQRHVTNANSRAGRRDVHA